VFAQRVGYTEKHLTDLLSGKKPLNQETAIRPERVTGTPARIWNNLETGYRERLVRLAEKQKLSEHNDLLNTPAIKELFTRGIIEKSNDTPKRVEAVLRFFGAGSIQALFHSFESPQKIALRHSVTFESDPLSLATWLRLGEQEASKISCKPYNALGFRKALQAIRSLTVKKPEEFEPEMVKLCADAGVAIVFIPEIKGAKVHGATKWLAENKAMIILNLRGRKDDIFWFTFFHEAAHILEGNKEALIVDVIGNKGRKTASEQNADRFAAELLIPPKYQSELGILRSRADVCSFASRLGIAPGIVVGRLQHDRIIRNSWFNDLKKTFIWKSE
jgi:HTH-type transcriptional regulator/antitoxin HigA